MQKTPEVVMWFKKKKNASTFFIGEKGGCLYLLHIVLVTRGDWVTWSQATEQDRLQVCILFHFRGHIK